MDILVLAVLLAGGASGLHGLQPRSFGLLFALPRDKQRHAYWRDGQLPAQGLALEGREDPPALPDALDKTTALAVLTFLLGGTVAAASSIQSAAKAGFLILLKSLSEVFLINLHFPPLGFAL